MKMNWIETISTAFCDGLRYSYFWLYAISEYACKESCVTNFASWVLGPLFYKLGFSKSFNINVISSVSGLFFGSRPLAIVRTVVSIVVDSVYGAAFESGVFERPFTKFFKVFPLYLYSSSAVASVVLVSLSIASGENSNPRLVKRICIHRTGRHFSGCELGSARLGTEFSSFDLTGESWMGSIYNRTSTLLTGWKNAIHEVSATSPLNFSGEPRGGTDFREVIRLSYPRPTFYQIVGVAA